jgi:predicted nuclease of predicted toxin-antitoxin system
MRFLIDECLCLDLVTVANDAGHDAYHVSRIGKAGWKDWNVARHARGGDLILVTNNAVDFHKIYAAQPLHPGLIILLPNVNRNVQRQLFRGALDRLSIIGEPVNQGLEVDLDGDDVVLSLYDLSSDPTKTQ